MARLCTAILVRALGMRFLPVLTGRIGHLAFETDAFIKEGQLGLRPPIKGILCAPAGKVANQHLAKYWSRYVTVVTSPLLCRCLCLLGETAAASYPVERYGNAVDSAAGYAAIQRAWGGRPPLLQLSDRDVERGWDRLGALGVPRHAWFVCVHSRERGYAPWDDDANAYRNSDVLSYVLAMQAIVDRGGWCIRMGNAAMKRLPALPGVIDYAHSNLKSDWMDVFLCGSCRFFLGNSSGLSSVCSVFGVPSALANLAPIGVLPFNEVSIGIPKFLWSQALGRHLTFPEAFASPVSRYWFMRQANVFEAESIQVVDNSPEDIRDLSLEMLDRLDGRWSTEVDDESLQQRFRDLMQPGHYSYGAPSRVGMAFLRKYAGSLA